MERPSPLNRVRQVGSIQHFWTKTLVATCGLLLFASACATGAAAPNKPSDMPVESAPQLNVSLFDGAESSRVASRGPLGADADTFLLSIYRDFRAKHDARGFEETLLTYGRSGRLGLTQAIMLCAAYRSGVIAHKLQKSPIEADVACKALVSASVAKLQVDKARAGETGRDAPVDFFSASTLEARVRQALAAQSLDTATQLLSVLPAEARGYVTVMRAFYREFGRDPNWIRARNLANDSDLFGTYHYPSVGDALQQLITLSSTGSYAVARQACGTASYLARKKRIDESSATRACEQAMDVASAGMAEYARRNQLDVSLPSVHSLAQLTELEKTAAPINFAFAEAERHTIALRLVEACNDAVTQQIASEQEAKRAAAAAARAEALQFEKDRAAFLATFSAPKHVGDKLCSEGGATLYVERIENRRMQVRIPRPSTSLVTTDGDGDTHQAFIDNPDSIQWWNLNEAGDCRRYTDLMSSRSHSSGSGYLSALIFGTLVQAYQASAGNASAEDGKDGLPWLDEVARLPRYAQVSRP